MEISSTSSSSSTRSSSGSGRELAGTLAGSPGNSSTVTDISGIIEAPPGQSPLASPRCRGELLAPEMSSLVPAETRADMTILQGLSPSMSGERHD